MTGVTPTTVISGNLQCGPCVPTMGLTVGGPQVYDTATPSSGFACQGTAAAPVNYGYRSPLFYAERFDASSPSANDNPNYSNQDMSALAVLECRALSTAGGTNPTGMAIRVRAEQQGNAGANSAVTGFVVMAELNASHGSNSYHAFAMNPIVSWQDGNAPGNLVGIELDMINAGGDSDTSIPGVSATNYTGLWLQQAAAGKFANTGIFISDSSGTGGWRYGSVLSSRFTEWMGKWVNDHATGLGLSLKVAFNGDNTRAILECRCGTGTERFVVKTDGTNPVYIMVESLLKQVTVGAADSGGVGYKLLRVVN